MRMPNAGQFDAKTELRPLHDLNDLTATDRRA
jgi:hypothetical protein